MTRAIRYYAGREFRLRQLAQSETELAAVRRLEDFTADEQDMRLAIAILESVGEYANASELQRQLGAAT